MRTLFRGKMGRKSKAQKIIEEQENVEDKHPETTYIVIYDFTEGNNPRPFYDNLHRLFEHYGGSLVQRSVVEIMGGNAGKAVQTLAEGYGASVLRYRVEKEE